MEQFNKRLEALKFVKDNNFEIEDKTIFETAEEVFKWASDGQPPKSIGEQCVRESTDEMDVRDRFTKVLDKVDPNWRNSRITPIQPVVLHGDKEEIAKVIDISEPFFDEYGNMIWGGENIFTTKDDCELEDFLQSIDDDDF